MPFDANGVATVTRTIAVTGQTIQAAQVNVPFADIQAMLSSTMLRTGVGQATGNLNFGGFKAVNLADGSNPNDAATKQQLDAVAQQIGASVFYTLVGTVDLTGAASTAGAFTGLGATVYDQYKIEILSAVPANNAQDIYFENSINNGVAYGATADVNWRRSQQLASSTSIVGLSGTGDTKVILANNISNTLNLSGLNASITLFPKLAARNRVIFSLSGHTGVSEFGGEGTGFFAAATNAIRIRPGTGNWTSGRINLYGLRH